MVTWIGLDYLTLSTIDCSIFQELKQQLRLNVESRGDAQLLQKKTAKLLEVIGGVRSTS